MKQTCTLVLILLTTLTVQSQQTENSKLPKHEIKINTVSLIGRGAVDITYEHIINEESSFGVSLFLKAKDNHEDYELYRTFSITPYYRVYFSKKYNKGFFVEGFSAFYTGEEYDYYDYDYYNSNNDLETYKGLALGIATGGKWVTKRGFVAEISIGIGRSILGGPDFTPIVGRGGITLGKRF